MNRTLDAQPLKSFTGDPAPPIKRQPPPPNHTPDAHLLVCHGGSDPLVSAKVVENFQAEMLKAPLGSCTFTSYAKVGHGFTTVSPEGAPASGDISFNMNAARRAWVSAFDVFSQAFDIPLATPVPAELWANRVVVPRF